MSIIVLIPALMLAVALFRISTQRAFRDFVLPVLLLCPIYFSWKVHLLPATNVLEAVLLPLGAAMFLTELRHWRFTALDGCMLFFLFTSFYGDVRAGHTLISIFTLFDSFTTAGLPYMAGRLLIEQHGARIATVKRIVFLLFIACLISTYEYRLGRNPFTVIFGRFFPGQENTWVTQIRWGFGRVAGPYAQSELAGMVVFFGLVLTLWLGYYNLWEPRFARLPALPARKATIIAWTLGLTLMMTQARGPWLGCLFAVPIAFIGRSKRVLRTALFTGFVCLAGAVILYVGIHNYVTAAPTSDEQETAHYRQDLLDNYIPIAQQGGLFGWGQLYPRVHAQKSIDNEYLLLAITQGYLGLGAFLLLTACTVVSLVRSCILSPTKRDQYFAFSLLGIFVGILLTITTVYLGSQPYVIFFLLAGWAQALPRVEQEHRHLVFDRVYT